MPDLSLDRLPKMCEEAYFGYIFLGSFDRAIALIVEVGMSWCRS